MEIDKTDTDVLRLSSAPIRERTRIDLLYDTLILLSVSIICLSIFMADIPFIDQLLFGGIVIWLAMNSLVPEVIIIDRADKTLTRERKLFDRWDVTKQTLSLAEYYGVRARSADGGNQNFLVELVGKYGAVMTLNNFTDIEAARQFRSMTAEFLQFKVILDPTNPNYT